MKYKEILKAIENGTRLDRDFSINRSAKVDDGVYPIVASHISKDRDNEIILPSSFSKSIGPYLKLNPVILWGHDYTMLPVGRADDGIITDEYMGLHIRFAPTGFAQEVKLLYDEEFLNMFSVGFIPMEGFYDQEDDAFKYTENELIETSCVPIPSNRMARLLRDAQERGFTVSEISKSLGIEKDEVTEVTEPREVVKSPYTGVAEKYIRRKRYG